MDESDAERARLQERRDELRRQRESTWDALRESRRFGDAGGESLHRDRLRELDEEISALEERIKAVGTTAETLTTATGLMGSAEDVTAPADELAIERRRAERDRADAAEREARLARRQAQLDQMGPAERALFEQTSAPDPSAVEAARAKDAVTKQVTERAERSGCLNAPVLAATIGIGFAVVVAIVLILLRDGSSPSPPSTGVDPPGGADRASGFAGHYVLAEGLDDPTGLDVHRYGGRSPGTVGSSSATIDIDGNGVITGGSLHTSIDQSGCHYTADAGSATGNVSASGTGSVVFNAAHTEGGGACRSFSDDYGLVYSLGIEGEDLYLCRGDMTSTTACSDGAPAARLVRRT